MALVTLESGEFVPNFAHALRIPPEFDGLLQKRHLGHLDGRHLGLCKHVSHSPELVGARQLPRYRAVGWADGQGSSVALLDEFEHAPIPPVHSDSDPGANVVSLSPLSRDVDAPLAHKETDELVVEGIHVSNLTALEA